jgi:hypothetical protein
MDKIWTAEKAAKHMAILNHQLNVLVVREDELRNLLGIPEEMSKSNPQIDKDILGEVMDRETMATFISEHMIEMPFAEREIARKRLMANDNTQEMLVIMWNSMYRLVYQKYGEFHGSPG